MPGVVDLEKARLDLKVKKGFRNWVSQFGEEFDASTRFCNIPDEVLKFLARGSGNSPFFFYDLIMNLDDLGSGFGFNELEPEKKLKVIDRHLFLLDRTRYEYMKRLEWLDSYSGEEYPVVELVIRYNELAPNIQAKPSILSRSHPSYKEYEGLNLFEKEQVIRKLIPEALKILDV